MTCPPVELVQFSYRHDPRNSTFGVSEPISNSPSRTGHANSSKTVLKQARPATSPRNPSRRDSVTPPRDSNPSSRRSSFAAQVPLSVHNRRPAAMNRSVTSIYDRPRGEDPFLIHRRSKQIFDSLGKSSDGKSRMSQGTRKHLVSPSLPELTRVRAADGGNEEPLPQYENHVPATIIDWTLPSTRRLEYREIDKSCQGVRGLWRRLAPRWCRRNSRLRFFDGDDSDAGSVRRYRLDLPVEDEKKKCKGRNRGDDAAVKEEEVDPDKKKGKWGSCLGF